MIYKMLRIVSSDDTNHTEDLSTTYDSVEEPQLDLEMNAAGSFSVTLRGYTPKKTAFRDDTYVVYEDGTEIFEGRPTEQERQYDGSVKIYCEGAYAYLQDGIVKPITGKITLDGSTVTPDADGGVELTPVQAVDYILGQYSTYMNDNYNRVITYNKDMIDISGTVYRKFDYEDCMSALSSLQDELGGQMWMSYTSGRPALCWLKDDSDKWPDSSQVVRLGINMTELSRKLTAGSVTAYMPLGNDIELIADDDTTTQEDDTHVKKKSSLVGQPLTLTNRTDVNNGSDIVTTRDADSFGDVVQVLRLSASTAQELLTKTREYISRQALAQTLTNVSAADLHYASGYEDANEKIQFATRVPVRASYDGETINEDLFCSSMQIDLYSAEKTVSLGTIQRESLSERQTAAEKTIEKNENNSDSNGATQDDIDNAINDAAASQADTDSKQDDRLNALEDAVKKLQDSSGSGTVTHPDEGDMKIAYFKPAHVVSGDELKQKTAYLATIYPQFSQSNTYESVTIQSIAVPMPGASYSDNMFAIPCTYSANDKTYHGKLSRISIPVLVTLTSQNVLIGHAGVDMEAVINADGSVHWTILGYSLTAIGSPRGSSIQILDPIPANTDNIGVIFSTGGDYKA